MRNEYVQSVHENLKSAVLNISFSIQIATMHKRPLLLLGLAFIISIMGWVLDLHEFNGDYVLSLFEVLMMTGIVFLFLWMMTVIAHGIKSLLKPT